ncbi:DUF5615 family PIN-like protein [Candidatus Eisenbacteria bacterium]|uniref:DUF5615 family PIN-like protein n=1 Tax=Eiseniibacteriota bacterium TaxID=2212470 RepID=A0ABV6YJL2_UNCEI
MKWVADENIDRQIVEALREDGHEVLSVVETTPTAADEDVLAMASDESALLLTADKDFGELVYRQGRASAGVVLIRLAGIPSRQKASIVTDAARRHGDELMGSFTVITPKAIRIRMG